jgi:hypothetical protein
LPTPWATKSRFMFAGRPSVFGAASLTPAPCTSTMTPMASALTTRSTEIRLKSGSAGSGISRGIAPSSSTRATLSAPVMTTARVGMISAIKALIVFSRVLASPNRMTSAASPVSSAARLMVPGWAMTSNAFAMAFGPSGTTPVRSPSWPQMMFTATPVRKPVMTE